MYACKSNILNVINNIFIIIISILWRPISTKILVLRTNTYILDKAIFCQRINEKYLSNFWETHAALSATSESVHYTNYNKRECQSTVITKECLRAFSIEHYEQKGEKKRGNVNKGRQTCKRSGKCKAKKRRKDKKLFAFYTDNKICINLRAKDLSRKWEKIN